MCVGNLSTSHTPDCYPSLLSHPGAWGVCLWSLWGSGGVAASPLAEVFAGGTLTPGSGKRLWFPHTRMGFGTMGPGLLRADEEIWKGF